MSKRSVLWNSFLIFLLAATLVALFMASIAMSVPPTHDVAVTDIALMYNTNVTFPTWENPLNITVTVKNNGTKTETFNVAAYYNDTLINSTSVNLQSEKEENVTFPWNFPDLPGYPDDPDQARSYPVYKIKANATLDGDEYSNNDEEEINGTLTIQWPGG